jgi:phosphoribosylanthranilate isomerase
MVKVKVCGLTDEDGVTAAVEAGADFLGVVFYAGSPRHVSVARAAELLDPVPRRVQRVGLFVDPDDAVLDAVISHVRLDFVQLHGSESVERVEAVRLEYGIPVIKAYHVGQAADLDAALPLAEVADWLLFDARPPAGAGRPGGNALSFDWTLLNGRKWPVPWMLAGGLDATNVREAIRLSGAKAVDVSSGVERLPGVKDARKIAEFVTSAKQMR